MRPEHPYHGHHFDALGTRCSVFVKGAPPEWARIAESWVRWMGERLTRFSDRSELSRLNASPGEWVKVSPDLESLLHASLRAFEMSGGLVNIAVLPSMLSIGYSRPWAERAPMPTRAAVRPLPRLTDVLSLQTGRARLESGAGLDLGGIAKGWMADRLVQILGPNSLVNLGGDLMARGPGPRGDGWPVAIAGVTVLLCDQGAGTSSVRRRRWRGAHHLIDPRTGMPSQSGLEEVSVVAESGFEAEVIAKTALLGGRGMAPAFCATQALAWWFSP